MAEARQQAPLPPNADVRSKAPLKCAIQLLKRRRDRWYAALKRDKDAPPSIVLTTFAAEQYDGVDNVVDTLAAGAERLGEIGNRIKPSVHNPAVPGEDFLKDWPAERLKLMREFATALAREVGELLRGGPNALKLLEEMFGEQVQPAYKKFAEEVKRQASGGSLRVDAKGLLGATGAAVQPHTFFGQ
jgi:hypothetical protein